MTIAIDAMRRAFGGARHATSAAKRLPPAEHAVGHLIDARGDGYSAGEASLRTLLRRYQQMRRPMTRCAKAQI
jgi:hypothetical protein